MYYLTSKQCVIPMDIFKEKKKQDTIVIHLSASSLFEGNQILSNKKERGTVDKDFNAIQTDNSRDI